MNGGFWQWLWQCVSDVLEAFKLAVTGFFGALVSGWFQRDDLKGLKEYIIFVVNGTITAHFLTDPVCDFFDVDPSNASGIGFLVGAFGGRIMQAVIKACKDADLWGLFKSRWGG